MTGSQYKRTSTAVLILAIAGLTLPLFYPLIAGLRPFMQCPSLVIFHNPCPLCGLTRGFCNIWKLHFSAATQLNILSVPFFTFLVAETFFRFYAITMVGRKPGLAGIARYDAIVHSILLAVYVAYACAFLALRWNFTL